MHRPRPFGGRGADLGSPSVDLPREFDIDIPKRGQSHRAQIIWSKDRSHGIAFVQKQPETGRGAGAAQASASSHVQDILDDARQQLAQAMGIPPDSIRLRIEIDG
ncbi:hypothetical protein ACFOYU_21780 [Microvirga sp. GCM10011540]|uniref:hypothetical protein n=1 Tax=Microvirga sp. GCM10011540 TaxID=3317338 RepID=UPI003612768F